MKIIQLLMGNGGMVALTDTGQIWQRRYNLPIIGEEGESDLEHIVYGDGFYEWVQIDPPAIVEEFGIQTRN